MKYRLGMLAIIVTGLGIGGVALLKDRAATAPRSVAAERPTTELADAAIELAPEHQEQAASPSEASATTRPAMTEQGESSSDRSSVPTAAFAGVLLDEEGRPIEGAQLSWTDYSEDYVTASTWLDLGPWDIGEEWYAEHTVWAESGPQGAFSFPEAPDSSKTTPSVIWATHKGHEALLLSMKVEPESWPVDESHVMTSSPFMVAHVIDAQGVAVPGAAVAQTGLVPNTNALLDPAPLEHIARVLLRREYESGESGEVYLSPAPGEIQVQARLGETISAPWTGEARSSIELRLFPSFTVSGHLSLSGSGEPLPGELSVVAEAWTGSHHGILERVPMEHGSYSWGPLRVSLSGADRYSFSLEAAIVTPRTQFISAPAPGEEVTVNFESSLGNEVWFVLEGPDGEWLEGEVELFWEGMDEHSSLTCRTRNDRYIRVLNCPTGLISSAQGSSPGYAPNSIEGFEVPVNPPGYVSIQLSRGGRITGHCLFGEEPVEDFEVVVWHGENTLRSVRKRVTGSEDGSFTMENAPLGGVQILASTGLLAPSATQVVQVVKGETVEVELVLREATQGVGRVVDEAGDPLPTASIQPYFQDGRQLVAKHGLSITVDSDGRFQLNELQPGRVGFKVTAPGYSTLDAWGQVQLGVQVDFGPLRLTRLRDLKVRVRFAQSLEPTQCSFFIVHPDTGEILEQPLSSEGTTTFEAVDEATLHGGIYLPDRAAHAVKILPRSGDDWTATYDVGGSSTIVLHLNLDSYDGELPVKTRAGVSKYGPKRQSFRRSIRLPESGEAIFQSLPPGEYIAAVGEEYVHVYGSTLVSVAEGETVHASIEYNGEPTVIRVVDKRGNPIPAVSVSLYAADYPLWRRAVTGVDGTCTISGSSAMDGFVGLQHTELGELWGVPIKLAQGAEEVIEVKFAPRGELRLHLVDEMTPLKGITCQLSASDNRNVKVAYPLSSDAKGNVTFERLGAALYGLELKAPGVWKKKVSLEVQPRATQRTIQLRRTGSARFQVTGRTGTPQPSTLIELTSTEFQTTLQTWIAEGRVQTSPASMTTAAEGTLLVPHIPHGAYRWRAISPDGEVLEGELEVPIANEAQVPIRFR